jgi:hypothetical protein
MEEQGTQNCQGAHGAVANATGREAPAQGSNPGCGTLKLQGLPWCISFKKKSDKIPSRNYCNNHELEL